MIQYDKATDTFQETTIIPIEDLQAQILQKQQQIQAFKDRKQSEIDLIVNLEKEISDLQTLIAQRPNS